GVAGRILGGEIGERPLLHVAAHVEQLQAGVGGDHRDAAGGGAGGEGRGRRRGVPVRLLVVVAVAGRSDVGGAVGEDGLAGALAGGVPVGGGAEAPVGAQELAGVLGLAHRHVGPGHLAGDGAAAPGGVEPGAGGGGVVAARLVGVHRDVGRGDVDQ